MTDKRIERIPPNSTPTLLPLYTSLPRTDRGDVAVPPNRQIEAPQTLGQAVAAMKEINIASRINEGQKPRKTRHPRLKKLFVPDSISTRPEQGLVLGKNHPRCRREDGQATLQLFVRVTNLVLCHLCRKPGSHCLKNQLLECGFVVNGDLDVQTENR